MTQNQERIAEIEDEIDRICQRMEDGGITQEQADLLYAPLVAEKNRLLKEDREVSRERFERILNSVNEGAKK